jgi:phage gp46-like protein
VRVLNSSLAAHRMLGRRFWKENDSTACPKIGARLITLSRMFKCMYYIVHTSEKYGKNSSDGEG